MSRENAVALFSPPAAFGCFARCHKANVFGSSSNTLKCCWEDPSSVTSFCYPPCHNSWLWTFCPTQAINFHRHKKPNKTQACLLQDTDSVASLCLSVCFRKWEKLLKKKKKMWLYNSSLCVPKDSELVRSASLSHRSTLLLWQTGRLTSFIPVAPLCSSSSS